MLQTSSRSLPQHGAMLTAALAVLGLAATAHAGLGSCPLGMALPDGLVCRGIATSPLGVTGSGAEVPVHGGLGGTALGIGSSEDGDGSDDGAVAGPPVLRGIASSPLGVIVVVDAPDLPPMLAVISPRDLPPPRGGLVLDGPRLHPVPRDGAALVRLEVYPAEGIAFSEHEVDGPDGIELVRIRWSLLAD